MELIYIKKTLDDYLKKCQGIHPSIYLNDTQKEEVLNQANRLMDQTFLFDRNWDMERCRKPYTLKQLDWEFSANGDPEWCFMLNRMDYLSDLLLASEMTNDRKYADKALFYIKDWLIQHPVIEPKDSTRTLDTAIRCWNIFLAIRMFIMMNLINDEDLEFITNGIYQQLEYLKKQYLCKYTLSNWGSIQTCVIVSILPFLFENYQQLDLYQWALKEVTTQFELQVYEDGMFWEQSTMYHVEVLSCGLTLLQQAEFFQLSITEETRNNIVKLSDSLLLQITPQKTIEAYGDSDEVYALDILQRAAIVLHDDKFVSLCVNEPFALENLYYLGDLGWKQYDGMKKENHLPTVYDGMDGGMFVVRRGWEADDSFTMFVNSSLGSGHGHSDNLHISIRDQGKRFFIDCGRYTYREDILLRMELKGLDSHNTMSLDDKKYSYPDGSWTNSSFGKPLKTYVRHQDEMHYYEGSVLSMDESGACFTRKVFVIDKGIWMIVDEVQAKGTHRLNTKWHLDPEVIPTVLNETTYELKNGDASLKIIFDQNIELGEANHSFSYNELEKHQVITATSDFDTLDQHVTIICRSDIKVEKVSLLQNNDKISDDHVVQAYQFTKPDNEKYTCICFHKEVYQGKKIFVYDGMPLHTKAAIAKEDKINKRIIRLKN